MVKFIIATTKSWNIKNFLNLDNKSFYLIKNKVDLIFNKINELKPKYIFFPHWSWIIPKEIYENFECIVFHMTDLPFGRGGSPLQNLIVREINNTKISALKVVTEIDAGPVYIKRNLSLAGNAEDIYKRASNIIFENMIPFIIKMNPQPVDQKGHIVTFKRRSPNQNDISKLQNLKKIYDYIRMLDAPGYPKAFAKLGKLLIEFSQSELKKGYIESKVIIKISEEDNIE